VSEKKKCEMCGKDVFENSDLCEKHHLRHLRYLINIVIPEEFDDLKDRLKRLEDEKRRVLDLRKERRIKKRKNLEPKKEEIIIDNRKTMREEIGEMLMNCGECRKDYCDNCANLKMLESMGELDE